MVGIDEVGRGALAGFVVVGAVVLSGQPLPPGLVLRDSKRATKRMREAVASYVQRELPHVVGIASPAEIDALGIVSATNRAAERALEQLGVDEAVLADAGLAPRGYSVQARIRADSTIPAVMLAANLAKVWRDTHMAALSLQHPGYGWEHNVGYGTKQHREAIRIHGLTDEHRRTFCAMLRP